jgi:hypothetical protein
MNQNTAKGCRAASIRFREPSHPSAMAIALRQVERADYRRVTALAGVPAGRCRDKRHGSSPDGCDARPSHRRNCRRARARMADRTGGTGFAMHANRRRVLANVGDRAGDTWDSVGRAVATSHAVRSTKGGMETSMPTAEEQWRVEAFDAVRGQRQWTCVTASISPDGARLCALYERPFSGIRCEVVLERDRFGSRPERYAEIRRRLHIRTSGGAGEPAA